MGNVFSEFKRKLLWIRPSYKLCVDETLYSLWVIYMCSVFVKFYNKTIIIGKCAFRQYIPSKPARYGIKYWWLVDTKSCYLCEVDIYLGKANLESQRETSVGLKVVKQLCKNVLNSIWILNSNRCVHQYRTVLYLTLLQR
jgi:hypothetical protein